MNVTNFALTFSRLWQQNNKNLQNLNFVSHIHKHVWREGRIPPIWPGLVFQNICLVILYKGIFKGSPFFFLKKVTFLDATLTWKLWMKSHSVDLPLHVSLYFILLHFIKLKALCKALYTYQYQDSSEANVAPELFHYNLDSEIKRK